MPKIENPTSEPVVFSDWGEFKLAMHTNEAYQRCVFHSANERTVTRLESLFTSQIDNWKVAAGLWGHMLQGCPEAVLPTEAEITEWNRIASTTNMPIEFIETGLLKPK